MSDTVLMYGFRIFWALFLGAMLAGTFHRSWNIENRDRYVLSAVREDTSVGIDPILFPIMLGFYILLYGVISGREKSRLYILNVSIDVFLFISVYFTLLLILLPVLRKYYTAKTCAAFWLVPVLLFYQPNMLYSRNMALPPKTVLYIPWDILRLSFLIWIAGFAVILAIQIISHINYAGKLKKNSRDVEEPELREKWKKLTREMGMSDEIGLRYCAVIRTPLSVGMRKKNRTTYLPERRFTEEEVGLIFLHELNHIRRNDIHTKFFLRFCTALGWFHPFVWLAVKKAEDDLELSCDEIVLKDADDSRRKKYAELLLAIAGEAKGFTTCLSATAETLRYRLRATVTPGKKRLGIGLLFVIMTVSCLSIGNIGIATERQTAAEAIGLKGGIENIEEFTYTENEKTFVIKDTERLAQYLSEIQVERLLAEYEAVNEDGIHIYGRSDGLEYTLYISGEYLRTGMLEEDGGYRYQTYHICALVDMEYIRTLDMEPAALI